MRTATISRSTAETAIDVTINLDGTGVYDVETGVGFFDHMLEQLSRHSLIDLTVRTKGDLHIDEHHTVEDTGIAIGQAFAQALGDKRGITRYGDALSPMDETLTRVALDISGRPWLVCENRSFQTSQGRPEISSATRVRVSSIGDSASPYRVMPRLSPSACANAWPIAMPVSSTV